jgi:hypothetical protein
MPGGRSVPPWVGAQLSPDSGPIEAGAELQRVVTVAPYWEAKPASGQDYYFNRVGVLPALGELTLGPAFRTQPGYRGVIASVQIFIDAITTAWDASFQIRIGGAPVPGLDRLTSFPRALSNFSQPYSAAAIIPASSTVDCLITNRAAVPFTVGIEVAGWSWPAQEEARVFGRLA